MVKLARKYRGMSQAQLAEKMGVKQGTVSKIEMGLIEATEEIVSGISAALGFPPAFFHDSSRVYPPSTPIQRKKSRLRKRDMDLAEATANLYLIHLRTLLEAVDVDVNVPEYSTRSGEFRPEQVAGLLRRRWSLPRGPVESVTCCMEDAGIFVFRTDLGTDQLDGFTLMAENSVPAVFANRAIPSDRARFTLAHELGHIVMHREQFDARQMEDEANRFAASFLMPADEIRPYLAPLNLERLAALKRHWKVSMQSLIRRARDLGQLSPDQASYLHMKLSRLGMRLNEGVDLPEETPTLAMELLSTYRTDLGYTDQDLLTALKLSQSDFRSLYNGTDSRLRLVRR